VVAPDDPSVIALRGTFFSSFINEQDFYKKSFQQQMNEVDEFIYEQITWVDSYSLYKMVGLLVTPSEVISIAAADCQGQAAVTASLLMSLGFNAWVVETPFHWWTHAQDPISLQEWNLNSHGHGGNLGNVAPQPIDLVFTHPRAACANCSKYMADNEDAVLFAASPWDSLQIAFTGAHIFVRSGLTFDQVNYLTLVEMVSALTAILAVLSTLVQYDSSLTNFGLRLFISLFCSMFAIIGMVFWCSNYYPVTLLHLAASIVFSLNFLSMNSFANKLKEIQ